MAGWSSNSCIKRESKPSNFSSRPGILLVNCISDLFSTYENSIHRYGHRSQNRQNISRIMLKRECGESNVVALHKSRNYCVKTKCFQTINLLRIPLVDLLVKPDHIPILLSIGNQYLSSCRYIFNGFYVDV